MKAAVLCAILPRTQGDDTHKGNETEYYQKPVTHELPQDRKKEGQKRDGSFFPFFCLMRCYIFTETTNDIVSTRRPYTE